MCVLVRVTIVTMKHNQKQVVRKKIDLTYTTKSQVMVQRTKPLKMKVNPN